MLVGSENRFPSRSINHAAPSGDNSLMKYGPLQLGLNFPLGSLINPLMTLKTESPLCNALSTNSDIFPYQREMKEEMDLSDLCLKPSSSLLDTSTTILNESCHRNSWDRSSHVLCREDSKDTNQRWTTPLRIKETWWSIVTHLTHGPLSQYCRVKDECDDNQRPCTSQCQASWTWTVDRPLVYYQDHPKSMNCQILSTA